MNSKHFGLTPDVTPVDLFVYREMYSPTNLLICLTIIECTKSRQVSRNAHFVLHVILLHITICFTFIIT